jgi:DNA-directed RNA polymerase specialized sigma24 family protein
MTMKKFTHAELAAAQQRGDWALLWQQAMPLVKLTVGRMLKSKERDEDVADDMIQQGMLIAGEAMRAWKPMECAFSTWIGNRVRDDLLVHAGVQANNGVGSHMQKPVILSLGDERPDARSDGDAEDSEDDGTFEAALTYAGVVMPGGQHDGDGYVPQGFGDPSEEADVGREAALRAALQHLTSEELELVNNVFGLGGGHMQTLAEYADARGIPYITARRRLQNARAILSDKLRNFRHS